MVRKLEQSRKLQKRAEQMIPGGVNSPVRAFQAVGGDPPFIVRGLGSQLWDADGNEYIDYIGSWGPLILGHAAPAVIAAITAAAQNGTSFGASTPTEADLAEIVLSAFPTMQKIRFVSSGTEATMSAIRLARAYTKRKYIVKFEGCYHGHADALLADSAAPEARCRSPMTFRSRTCANSKKKCCALSKTRTRPSSRNCARRKRSPTRFRRTWNSR